MMDETRVMTPHSMGEVFTRPEVVEYILRATLHFAPRRSLSRIRFLEPSCGRGAFVLPLIEALARKVRNWDNPALKDFLCACDISRANIEYVSYRVRHLLLEAKCPVKIADTLVKSWFVCDDFLLHDFNTKFDIIIGNPPYIRFDELGERQKHEYRRRYVTFSNRCDIYIPFFEKSLFLLEKEGVLSFICTNRFTRNRYGTDLRRLISDAFHVALYINMEHTQPFQEKVSAYPAIFTIDRRKDAETLSVSIDDASRETFARLSLKGDSPSFSRFRKWYEGDEIWTTTSAAELTEAKRIEYTYPTIEESAPGTKIGIGVASGADKIFLDAQRHADIEPERLIPLIVSEDIRGGIISWNHHYILNPYDFSRKGGVINLAEFPKTAAYLKRNASRLKARYCVKANGDEWFRTLDKINCEVFRSAKLLLPDIQSGGNVALDERGEFYPHHNVYWITSSSWNLKALCVIMRSAFVTDQIKRISVQMRGGSVRYQAQNLRNVHIPAWESISPRAVSELENLYDCTDQAQIDGTVKRIACEVAYRQPACPRQGILF